MNDSKTELKNDSDLDEFLKELKDFKPSLIHRLRLKVMKTLFNFEILLGNIWSKFLKLDK